LAYAQRASDVAPTRLSALAIKSAALLALGRAGEAKEVAALGVQIADELGGAHEIKARLALVEALHSLGEADAAHAALEKALERLRLRVDDIPDAAARERYLTRVPANARLVALVRERLGLEALTTG
jgi:hypothetical protein